MTNLTPGYLLTPFRLSDFFQMMWGTCVRRQHDDRSPGHSGILCGAPQVLQRGFVSKRVSQISFTPFLSFPTVTFTMLLIRTGPVPLIGLAGRGSVTGTVRRGPSKCLSLLWVVIWSSEGSFLTMVHVVRKLQSPLFYNKGSLDV